MMVKQAGKGGWEVCLGVARIRLVSCPSSGLQMVGSRSRAECIDHRSYKAPVKAKPITH